MTTSDRKQTVLFLGHYHEQVRSTVLPVCRQLNAFGALSSLVVAEADPGEKIARLCDAAGVAFTRWGRKKSESAPAATTSSPGISDKPAARQPVQKADRSRQQMNSLRRYLKDRSREAATRISIAYRSRFLRRVGTVVLVVPDDRTHLTMRWLAASRSCGIPSMLTQWAAFHQASTYIKLRAAHPSGCYVTELTDPISEAIAQKIPAASRIQGDRRVWFFEPSASLLYDRLGLLLPPGPFTFGSGAADVTTFLGAAWKRRVIAEGVVDAGLAVTGHPDQDRWHLSLQRERGAAKSQLAGSIEAAPERPWLTVIAPSLRFRDGQACRAGEISADRLLEDLSKTVLQMRAVASDAEIIIKAHPRDPLSRLESIRKYDPRVKLASDVSTDMLIRSSEVVACQWSTAAMMAIALQVPLVLFDFHRCESGEVYEGILDVPVARTPESLRGELSQLLGASAYRDRRMAKQAELARDCLKVDGQATARICQLVYQLAGVEAADDSPGRAA